MLAVLFLGSFLFLELATPPAVLPSDTHFLSDRDSVEDEVVGREAGAGGWGNAPMLIVFRTAFADGIPEAFPAAEPALTVGTSGVDRAGCRVGRAEGLDGALMRDGVTGRLLRGGLGSGMGGSAPVGGSAAGRARTGRDIFNNE